MEDKIYELQQNVKNLEYEIGELKMLSGLARESHFEILESHKKVMIDYMFTATHIPKLYSFLRATNIALILLFIFILFRN